MGQNKPNIVTGKKATKECSLVQALPSASGLIET